MSVRLAKLFLIYLFLNPLFLFSQDQSQYPDTIVDAYNTITKTSYNFFGGTPANFGRLVSLDALLHRTDTFVSLPMGSYVVLGFTDNYVVDAPYQKDIFIEEVGGAGEFAEILVSTDNEEFTSLGIAGNGKINEFDLASISYGKPVSYIKIIGKDANGSSPGFDVRRVYGLPGSNMPKPKDPIILENVLFKTNKADLTNVSFPSLDILVQELRENALLKIEIRGHTDNIGGESQNQVLSEQRAKTVLDYLVSKGIDTNRLSSKGFGSALPIASNDSEEGRNKNRRVEFLKVE